MICSFPNDWYRRSVPHSFSAIVHKKCQNKVQWGLQRTMEKVQRLSLVQGIWELPWEHWLVALYRHTFLNENKDIQYITRTRLPNNLLARRCNFMAVYETYCTTNLHIKEHSIFNDFLFVYAFYSSTILLPIVPCLYQLPMLGNRQPAQSSTGYKLGAGKTNSPVR